MGLGSEIPGFEFLFNHFQLCNPVQMAASVSLDILIYKRGLIIPTSYSHCED